MRWFGVRAAQGLGGLLLCVSGTAALGQAAVPQVLATSMPLRADGLRDAAPLLRLDLDLGQLRWAGPKREPGQPWLSVLEIEPEFRPGPGTAPGPPRSEDARAMAPGRAAVHGVRCGRMHHAVQDAQFAGPDPRRLLR